MTDREVVLLAKVLDLRQRSISRHQQNQFEMREPDYYNEITSINGEYQGKCYCFNSCTNILQIHFHSTQRRITFGIKAVSSKKSRFSPSPHLASSSQYL